MGSPGAVDKSKPPITLEQWVELLEARERRPRRAGTRIRCSRSTDERPRWSNAGAWWSTHFAQNAMKNGGELHQRFSQLSDFYKQKFAAPTADGDLSF